jgi:hypothetical protein
VKPTCILSVDEVPQATRALRATWHIYSQTSLPSLIECMDRRTNGFICKQRSYEISFAKGPFLQRMTRVVTTATAFPMSGHMGGRKGGTSLTREQLLHQLSEQIVSLSHPHLLRVALDGIDVAGKTTLADELAPLIEAQGSLMACFSCAVNLSISGTTESLCTCRWNWLCNVPCSVICHSWARLRRFGHASCNVICLDNAFIIKPPVLTSKQTSSLTTTIYPTHS